MCLTGFNALGLPSLIVFNRSRYSINYEHGRINLLGGADHPLLNISQHGYFDLGPLQKITAAPVQGSVDWFPSEPRFRSIPVPLDLWVWPERRQTERPSAPALLLPRQPLHFLLSPLIPQPARSA